MFLDVSWCFLIFFEIFLYISWRYFLMSIYLIILFWRTELPFKRTMANGRQNIGIIRMDLGIGAYEAYQNQSQNGGRIKFHFLGQVFTAWGQNVWQCVTSKVWALWMWLTYNSSVLHIASLQDFCLVLYHWSNMSGNAGDISSTKAPTCVLLWKSIRLKGSLTPGRFGWKKLVLPSYASWCRYHHEL